MSYCRLYSEFPCSIEISLIAFSSLMILINIISIIHMLSFTKKMTFEAYILFSGIIENIFYLLYKLLKNTIYTSIQVCLQEIINLCIIFRFSLIFLKYQKKIKKKITYAIFFTVVAINISFEFIYFINIRFNFIKYPQVYDTFLNSFYVCISFCLVLFGTHLKKLIRDSLIEAYLNESDYSIDVNNNKRCTWSSGKLKDLEKKEIYSGTRIQQINIVIYSDFITDSIELISSILTSYVLDGYFEVDGNNKHYLLAKNVSGWVILYVDDLCSLIVSFTNYVAFYFIIRKSYMNVKSSVGKSGSIVIQEEQVTQTDIKEYMSFYTNRDTVNVNGNGNGNGNNNQMGQDLSIAPDDDD